MRCPAHLIVTLRAKTVTEQTKDEKGKPVVLDLGLFPQQRYDGEEFVYGLDISGRLDPEGEGVRPDHHQHALWPLARRQFRSTPTKPSASSWPPGSTRAWRPAGDHGGTAAMRARAAGGT